MRTPLVGLTEQEDTKADFYYSSYHRVPNNTESLIRFDGLVEPVRPTEYDRGDRTTARLESLGPAVESWKISQRAARKVLLLQDPGEDRHSQL